MRLKLDDGTVAEGSPEELAEFRRLVSERQEASEEENDLSQEIDWSQYPSPPPVDEVASYIEDQPSFQHGTGKVIAALAGVDMPSRVEGEQNPVYNKWVKSIERARKQIENEHGVSFEKRREGRQVIYEAANKQTDISSLSD